MKKLKKIKQWCVEMRVYLLSVICCDGLFLNQAIASAEGELKPTELVSQINKIANYCAVIGFGTSGLAIIAIGFMCSLGGQKGRSMAKDHAFGVIIGILCFSSFAGLSLAVKGFFAPK